MNDLLDGHVELECPDRTYLNRYVQKLQVAGQAAVFMTRHDPGIWAPVIPSPAKMEKFDSAFADGYTRIHRMGDSDQHAVRENALAWRDDRTLSEVRS